MVFANYHKNRVNVLFFQKNKLTNKNARILIHFFQGGSLVSMFVFLLKSLVLFGPSTLAPILVLTYPTITKTG